MALPGTENQFTDLNSVVAAADRGDIYALVSLNRFKRAMNSAQQGLQMKQIMPELKREDAVPVNKQVAEEVRAGLGGMPGAPMRAAGGGPIRMAEGGLYGRTGLEAGDLSAIPSIRQDYSPGSGVPLYWGTPQDQPRGNDIWKQILIERAKRGDKEAQALLMAGTAYPGDTEPKRGRTPPELTYDKLWNMASGPSNARNATEKLSGAGTRIENPLLEGDDSYLLGWSDAPPEMMRPEDLLLGAPQRPQAPGALPNLDALRQLSTSPLTNMINLPGAMFKDALPSPAPLEGLAAVAASTGANGPGVISNMPGAVGSGRGDAALEQLRRRRADEEVAFENRLADADAGYGSRTGAPEPDPNPVWEIVKPYAANTPYVPMEAGPKTPSIPYVPMEGAPVNPEGTPPAVESSTWDRAGQWIIDNIYPLPGTVADAVGSAVDEADRARANTGGEYSPLGQAVGTAVSSAAGSAEAVAGIPVAAVDKIAEIWERVTTPTAVTAEKDYQAWLASEKAKKHAFGSVPLSIEPNRTGLPVTPPEAKDKSKQEKPNGEESGKTASETPESKTPSSQIAKLSATGDASSIAQDFSGPAGLQLPTKAEVSDPNWGWALATAGFALMMAAGGWATGYGQAGLAGIKQWLGMKSAKAKSASEQAQQDFDNRMKIAKYAQDERKMQNDLKAAYARASASGGMDYMDGSLAWARFNTQIAGLEEKKNELAQSLTRDSSNKIPGTPENNRILSKMAYLDSEIQLLQLEKEGLQRRMTGRTATDLLGDTGATGPVYNLTSASG